MVKRTFKIFPCKYCKNFKVRWPVFSITDKRIQFFKYFFELVLWLRYELQLLYICYHRKFLKQNSHLIKLPSIEIRLKIAEASQKVAVSTFKFTDKLNVTFVLKRIITRTQRMAFFVKDFFSKCDQNSRKLGICPHFLTKISNVKLNLWKK